MKEVLSFETKDELENSLLDFFINQQKNAVEKKGLFCIALSGGNTPLSFYEKLANKINIKWDKTHIFFVDDRMVKDDSNVSNTHQIKKVLLDKIVIPEENIHFIDKSLDENDAALEYELEIKSFFKEEVPSFDFILLGIGEDGHMASLFPHSDTLKEKNKLVVSSSTKQESFFRISFSLKLINHTKVVVFMVVGNNKARIIKKIIQDKDIRCPATHVKAKEKVVFFLDSKAAIFLLSM